MRRLDVEALERGRRLSIGLAYQGDTRSPREWSGTPAGLASGLQALGVDVVHLRAGPPRLPHELAMRVSGALRGEWLEGRHSPEMAALRTAVLRRAIRRARHVDGVVQIGSEFRLPAGVSYVTFEDMTVRQAVSRPEHGLSSLRPAVVRPWITRQSQLYADAQGCAAASAWAAASLRDDYGVPATRVGVVGLAPNRLRVAKGRRDWTRPRFLFVAKAFERKRGPLVLRAFAGVRAVHPDATLDVVGRHPPLDEPGVSGHGLLPLHESPARQRLDDLFARATCLVVPSPYEPFGVVFVEAGANHVPSIATTTGGAATAIGPGGILVPPNDAPALQAAMARLAEPAEAERIGSLAARHAAAFTWPRVAERTLRLLRPRGIDLRSLEPLLRDAV